MLKMNGVIYCSSLNRVYLVFTFLFYLLSFVFRNPIQRRHPHRHMAVSYTILFYSDGVFVRNVQFLKCSFSHFVTLRPLCFYYSRLSNVINICRSVSIVIGVVGQVSADFSVFVVPSIKAVLWRRFDSTRLTYTKCEPHNLIWFRTPPHTLSLSLSNWVLF